MEVSEIYKAGMLPPPDGLEVPERFIYIRVKAYRYLKMGPDAYSAQDAFGMPPRGASPEVLTLVEQGCKQIADWRGLSPERPLQGLGINAFYRLIEVFHFRTVRQRATFGRGDGDSIMDQMTIEHVVYGDAITLYNLVEKQPQSGISLEFWPTQE